MKGSDDPIAVWTVSHLNHVTLPSEFACRTHSFHGTYFAISLHNQGLEFSYHEESI